MDTKTDMAKENIVGEEAENKRIDALLFILLWHLDIKYKKSVLQTFQLSNKIYPKY